MRVILASESPRRRELLGALVDGYQVIPAAIAEPLGSDALSDARTLARDKAQHVAALHRGAVVIGADTIVFDDLRLYGKPADGTEALEMLRELRARTHRVVTGVAVVKGVQTYSDASVSAVTLADLSDDDIAGFVASGVPLDKAGAYAIQYDDLHVVERLDGCYCNVVGLPLWRLRALLGEAGLACAEPSATYGRCAECPDRPASP